jgi:hypothetical protein
MWDFENWEDLSQRGVCQQVQNLKHDTVINTIDIVYTGKLTIYFRQYKYFGKDIKYKSMFTQWRFLKKGYFK